MKRIAIALAVLVGLMNPSDAGITKVRRDIKLALVIGNADYKHAAKLGNSDEDAEVMAAKFTELGFNVSSLIDGTETELRKTVKEFIIASAEVRVAAVYYAGHGLMVNGEDYMLPTDFDPSQESAAISDAVKLGDVLRALEATGATTLSFVDTNRTAGFKDVEYRGPDGFIPGINSAGTVISFSSLPGGSAFEGKGKNSPYTTALLKHIGTPGLDIEQALTLVRLDVFKETEAQQMPWNISTLTRPLFLGSSR